MIFDSLKSLRLGENLTQVEFAKKLGISQKSYHKLEVGNPTIRKLAEIADKLGYDFEVVFSPKK